MADNGHGDIAAVRVAEPAAPPNSRLIARHAIAALENLGDWVILVREDRGLSYRAAADQIGIAHSTMYGIETGKRDPGVIVTLRVLRWIASGDSWD